MRSGLLAQTRFREGRGFHRSLPGSLPDVEPQRTTLRSHPRFHAFLAAPGALIPGFSINPTRVRIVAAWVATAAIGAALLVQVNAGLTVAMGKSAAAAKAEVADLGAPIAQIIDGDAHRAAVRALAKNKP